MINNQTISTPHYYLSLEDDMLRIRLLGETQTEEVVRRGYKDVLALVERVPGKVKILIDLRRVGKIASARARMTYAQAARDKKFSKIALFGGKTLHKVLASFVIKASGINNAKNFQTEQEALSWLKASNAE